MIKPKVVCIKGVHSTTGADQASDIGFPQLELEKLFEGATIRALGSSDSYEPTKKYIYQDGTEYHAIQNEDHFACIKNGYTSLPAGINHYYTEDSDKYTYHAVPATDTWTEKHTFSDTLSDGSILYSIDDENKNKVCIDGNYYDKNGNDFVKQNPQTYTLYETVDISWQEQYKYNNYAIDDDTTGYNWKNTDGELAKSGYYISVLKQTEESTEESTDNMHYIIQLQYINFTDGVWDNNSSPSSLTIYKFNYDSDSINDLYVKNEDQLDNPASQSTFTSDPTTTISCFYREKGTWLYPNISSPSTAPDLMKGPNDNLLSYSDADYPLYEEATATTINKIQNTSYTVYEKTAVSVDYRYEGNANTLQFIFTDKTISEVLTACGLNNSLSKYIHLTNLGYNRN